MRLCVSYIEPTYKQAVRSIDSIYGHGRPEAGARGCTWILHSQNFDQRESEREREREGKKEREKERERERESERGMERGGNEGWMEGGREGGRVCVCECVKAGREEGRLTEE